MSSRKNTCIHIFIGFNIFKELRVGRKIFDCPSFFTIINNQRVYLRPLLGQASLDQPLQCSQLRCFLLVILEGNGIDEKNILTNHIIISLKACNNNLKCNYSTRQVVKIGSKKTAFANFSEICRLLHRIPKHLLQFLLAELGTSGSIDGNQLLLLLN